MPQESQNSNTSAEVTTETTTPVAEALTTSPTAQDSALSGETSSIGAETKAAPGQLESASDAFSQALSAQQTKNDDQALTLYHQILDQGLLTAEQASVISHNISLIYFQKKELPLAIVFNQKAVHLDLGNKAARNFQEMNKLNIQSKSVPHTISFIENLNSTAFRWIPIELLFVFVVIFFAVSLNKILRYFLERKKQSVQNENPTAFPMMALTWIGLFLISSVFFTLKYSDLRQTKAIVRAEKTTVQTAPGGNQAVIFELESGMIIQVLQTHETEGETYVQIKYPGAFSGWVKKQDLELLNRVNWP